MMRKLLCGVVAALPLLLVACTLTVQPPITGENSAGQERAGAPASLTLGDGVVCRHAGEGATAAFDGERVSYTCEPAPEGKLLVILGDAVVPSQVEWTVKIATIGRTAAGLVLENVMQVPFTVHQVVLADGLACQNAGLGETVSFDGKRLGFTCDKAAAAAKGVHEVGLIGDFIPGEAGVYSVELAYVNRTSQGFTLMESEVVPVAGFSALNRRGQVAASAAARTLLDRPWQWVETSYGDGTRVVASDPTRYTVIFNSDGQLQAQLDCNRGMAAYTLHNNELAIGPIVSTKVGCPDDSQAAVFANDLAAVTAWYIEGDMLYLDLAEDGGAMSFRHAP